MKSSRQIEDRVSCEATGSSDCAGSRRLYQTLLLVCTLALWIVLFAVFAAVGGCGRAHCAYTGQPAGATQPVCYKNIRFVPVLVQPASIARSSLIYPADPELTPIPAEAFSRADWPSTPGRYDAGQVVSYQEYSFDAQGLSSHSPNYGHRTFTTRRYGLQYGP